MVRHVKPILGLSESETQPRHRNLVSHHPPDNIDISCTVQGDGSRERISPGRRRSFVVPRDNIGIACLPTAERLGNIQEVPEYESLDEDRIVKVPQGGDITFEQSNLKTKVNFAEDETSTIDQSATSSVDSDPTPYAAPRFDRGRSSCKRRDTVGLLWHESDKKCGESKKTELKFQQPEMGISNIRRPRDDPTRPRRPILPRDNIGFNCRPLHKSAYRLSGSRLSTGVNLKSSSNVVKRKNYLQAKQSAATRIDNATGDQIKTLKTTFQKTRS